MSTEFVPDSLREAVAAELKPVRPVRPVWQRVLAVASVVSLVLASIWLGFKLPLRVDLESRLGRPPMWGIDPMRRTFPDEMQVDKRRGTGV